MFATLGARLGMYAAIAAFLIGLGAGTCWYFAAGRIASLRAERDALTEQLQLAAKARRIADEVSQARAVVRTKRAGEARSAATGLDSALAKNKAWADAPVPQEVRDALR